MSRKVFKSRDQNGNVISIDSVSIDNVLFDTFSIEEGVYRLVIRAFAGSITTQWKNIRTMKVEGGAEVPTNSFQFVPHTFGSFDNIVLTLTEKEEIDDAWAWLHPGQECPAWKYVEEAKLRMERFNEFKKDPRNYETYDRHVDTITEWLKKKNHSDVADWLIKAQTVYVKKRTAIMETLDKE